MAVVFAEDAEGVAVADPVTSARYHLPQFHLLMHLSEDWEALCPKYNDFHGSSQ